MNWSGPDCIEIVKLARAIAPSLKDVGDDAEDAIIGKWSKILPSAEAAKAWLTEEAAGRKAGQRYLGPGDVTEAFRRIARQHAATQAAEAPGATDGRPRLWSDLEPREQIDLDYNSPIFGKSGPLGRMGLLYAEGKVDASDFRHALNEARSVAMTVTPASKDNPYAKPGDTWEKWDRPKAAEVIIAVLIRAAFGETKDSA